METRPHYETLGDRKEQAEVEAEVGKFWNVSVKRLPFSYRIDCALVRKGESQAIVGWMEVKVRTNSSTAYPTYMIALGKWLAGIDLEEKTNLPFILTVKFTDGILTCRPSQCRHSIVWGGRTLNTRDSADVEPVVHIPMEFFRPLVATGEKA